MIDFGTYARGLIKKSAKLGWAFILLTPPALWGYFHYVMNLIVAAEQNSTGYKIIEAGRPEAALLPLREAVKLAPNQGDYHNNLGYALMLTGNLEESERECRLAVILEPDHSWCQDSLGQILTQRGKLVEAVKVCRYALQIAPPEEESVYLNSLGRALYLSGEKANARHLWRRVTQSASNEKELHRAEGYLKKFR